MKNEINNFFYPFGLIYNKSSEKLRSKAKMIGLNGPGHLLMVLDDIGKKRSKKVAYYEIVYRGEVFTSTKMESIISFVVGLNGNDFKDETAQLTEHKSYKAMLKSLEDVFGLHLPILNLMNQEFLSQKKSNE